MANSRLIYFSDEAFNRLESMTLYDKNGKLLSRAKKINYLILDKFKLINENNMVDKKSLLADLRNFRSGLVNASSMLMMENYARVDEILVSLSKLSLELIEVLRNENA